MSNQALPGSHSAGAAGRMLYGACRILALIGGILACAMALLMSASVAGRAVVGYPIPGDYEITGVINGTVIFAFLPYCQLMRANVIVDFFTGRAPAFVKAALDALGSLLFLAMGALLTWRLVVGGFDMYKNSDVTPTLSFPLWITVPFDIVCMVVLVLVTGYTMAQSISEMLSGGSGQTDAENNAG